MRGFGFVAGEFAAAIQARLPDSPARWGSCIAGQLRMSGSQCLPDSRMSSAGYGAVLPGFSGYANLTNNGTRAGVNYGSQIKCFAGYANFTRSGAPRIR